jgi:Mg2+/Co2+ transporter CorB
MNEIMENVWFDLLGLLFLLLAAAFFAGSETAVTAASRGRMHALENEGNRRAALINKLREKKEKLIGALLLGNTLVSVSIGSLATAATIATIGEEYVVPVTFSVATLLLIFSEVMPKTYALMHPDKMSLFFAPLVSFVVTIFSPATHAVEKTVQLIFKIFGVDNAGHSREAQVEELRGAIDLLKPDEEMKERGQEKQAMLRSILDLANVTVEKIMIHRRNVRMVDIDLPVGQFVDEVLNSSYTRLPVWKESPDNIVGIVHTKLLLQEVRASGGDISRVVIQKALLAPWFIPESTTLFDQLQAFRKRREHFALMVDEYGALTGVVTLEDILEEIVGQIDDEHDSGVGGLRRQLDGSCNVEGAVTIRDLNRDMGWNIPDEEYATVPGLLLHESQRIPSVGQSFNFFGYRFQVLKKNRNQVTMVNVQPLEKKNEDKKSA